MTDQTPRTEAGLRAEPVPDTADPWWNVVENGESIALTDEATAHRIVVALTEAQARAEGLDVEALARLHHEGGWAPGGCTQRTSKEDEPWTEIEWFMCPKSDVHRAFGEWMSRAILSETER